MLKLNFQYFGHLMLRANSFEKTLILGKIEGRRRRGWQRMRWLDDITNSMDMSLSKLWEIVKAREICCSPCSPKELDMTEWLNNNKKPRSTCCPPPFIQNLKFLGQYFTFFNVYTNHLAILLKWGFDPVGQRYGLRTYILTSKQEILRRWSIDHSF